MWIARIIYKIMKENYYMVNINTGEKFLLVSAKRPSISAGYIEKDGIKQKTDIQWNPIEYDYAELVIE
jgi:hypothetical protein